MMRWIVRSSLRSRGLVVAAAVAVLVLGVSQLQRMPRDVLPEFRPPTVEVQTEALGLSAEEVEELITSPLEQDLLNGVAFLDVIRSQSLPGMSRIEMIFEPGTTIERARLVVNERLTQAAALPNVSKPPQMLQPLSSTSRVMMVGLSSKSQSLIDMSLLARWTIRPRLLGIPGVSNVAIWGQREQQLQVQVDPAQLHAKGVTLDQVIHTTGNALWVSPLTFLEASTPGTGGFFDTQSQRLGVQHVQPITRPEDLAKVTVEPAEGAPAAPVPLRLGDVATVVEDHQPLIGDAVFTDGPGLMIVVEKLPEANTIEVTKALESAMSNLAPGLAGIDVDTSFFQPARYLESSNDNLRTGLLIGLVLLALALLAFLLDLRIVFVSLVAVLLSLAAAVVVLEARGVTLNAMVLAGLAAALVLLIDDAVVSADSTRRGLGDGDAVAAGRVGARVLGAVGPLAYGTAVALLLLVPITVLRGEMGAFLPPLAFSYALAVLASLVVALTVTPALTTLLLSRGRASGRTSPVLRWLQPRYDRTHARTLGAPRAGAALIGVLLVLGVLLLPLLDRGDSLVPEFKDRDVLISLTSAPGTSLPEMSRIAAEAGGRLRALDGVDNVGGHVGRAVSGDQPVSVNSAELWVSIESDADYEDTTDRIRGAVDDQKGVEASVLTYPQERIDDVLRTADGVEGKDLTVRVFGHDLATLKAQAERVSKLVGAVDGARAPVVELPVEEPTLQVEVDLERAQSLGVKPGDVRRAAATMVAGIEVGNLFEDQKVFEVVVRGTPATRDSVDKLRQLLVDRPDGAGQVRLDQVADVQVVQSPNVIRHEDVSRSIDVGVDVGGRDVDAVAGEIKDRIRDVNFPIEFHAELLGDYAEDASGRLRFLGVALAAAVGVLLLLQAAAGSWRMAAVAFLALPAALTGGVLAAVLDGDAVSIGSVAGFLAIAGLAARNVVLFLRRCHDMEDYEGAEFGRELVDVAARDRLAPTIAGAVATALVFLPLLFFGGRAGFEVVHPMAAVVIGGLVTATVVSVFALPALYLRFGRRSESGRERFDMALDLGEVPFEPTSAHA
jgi:Cu/Ag efflux pump CusA